MFSKSLRYSLLITIIAFFILSDYGLNLQRYYFTNANIRTIKTTIKKINAFERAYSYKPGDFPLASYYWGTLSCGGSKYGANGNGDGIISSLALTEKTDAHDNVKESELLWCHMSMAGLLNKAGTHSLYNNLQMIVTNNIYNIQGIPIDKNLMFIGKDKKTTIEPGLTPKEALAINKALDNGSPTTGRVQSPKNDKCFNAENDYLVDVQERVCLLYIFLD